MSARDLPHEPLHLVELLLENSEQSMSVYVVTCGHDKSGWMPITVRRSLPTAMMYCLERWGFAPDWTDPGYWRKELEDSDGRLVIEIFEMTLES